MAAPRAEDYRWRSTVALCSIWLAVLAANVYGDCGPPLPVQYAIPEEGADSHSFPVGSTVTYKCDASKHYVKIADKSDTVSCLENSTWSLLETFCQLKGCGKPTTFDYGEPLDGYITTETFPVGSTVKYKCRPGYELKFRGSKPALECLKSLTWSTKPELCRRKDCENPREPQNGIVSVPDGDSHDPDTKFGSRVTFSCLTGFRLIGRNTRTCTANGWSNAVPRCAPVLCGDPPDIANGTHSGYGQDEFQYLSAVTYTCNNNYFRLSGSRVNYCTDMGEWKEPAPVCKDIRCADPVVKNGHKVFGFKSQYVISDAVQFSCDEGFNTKDVLRIHCEEKNIKEENKWVPQEPKCEPIVCGEPPATVNGSHSGIGRQVFSYHEYVTYHCVFEDLSLIGDDKIQCIGDGYWSGKAPLCKDVLCEVPILRNAKITKFKLPLRYKSIIEIKCDKYFTLKGTPPHRIQCSENSTWIPEVPVCKDLRCHDPVLKNEIIWTRSKPPYQRGNELRISCIPGFKLNGSNSIRCGEDNGWHPPAPVCRPVICREPPDVEYGTHNGMNRKEFGYKDIVEYQCNSANLLLVGKNTITCQQNEIWSRPTPICKVVICANPDVRNGTIVTDLEGPFQYRHTVAIECHRTFRLEGANISECGKNGQWIPPLPLCQRTTCPRPVEENGNFMVLGGNRTETAFKNDTVYEVVCNEGYSVVGGNTAYCDVNYNWNATFPSCVPTPCPEPVVENGHAIVMYSVTGVEKEYRVSDKMEVRCNGSYALNGTGEIVCQADSTWSSLPTCQFVSCGEPHVENSRIVCRNITRPALQSGYRLSDSITFQCNDGYTMNGTNQIQCKADSVWSTLPTCNLDKGSRFLPVGQLTLTEDKRQTLQNNTNIETRATDICNLVDKSIHENWAQMNFGEKYTHLQMKKLCTELNKYKAKQIQD